MGKRSWNQSLWSRLLGIFVLICICTLVSACGRQDKIITSLEDFDSPENTYAVQTGTASAVLAEENFHKAREKQYGTMEDCIQAVKSGKADGLFYDVNILNYYRSQDPDSLSVLKEELPEMKEIGIAISRVTKVPGLKDQLNEFIRQTKADGTFDEMFQRWVNSGTEEMPDIPLPQNPTRKLIAGFTGTMAPFNYIKDNQKFGFDVEFMRRFALYAGYDLEFRSETTTSMITDLETGTIDVMCSNLHMSEERKEVVDFSDLMYESHTALMVRNPDAMSAQVSPAARIQESFEKTLIREARWKMILQGLGVTLIIAIGAVILGTLIGFILCFAGRTGQSLVTSVVNTLCRIVNGIPMLVTLMIFFYVILNRTGLPEIVVAIIAFAVDFGVHVRGILDTGISSVASGELEAAYALGMSRRQAFRKVILPQAIAHIMPLYQGQIVALVKETAIVGYIAIVDLTKASDIIRSRTFEAFFPLVITAVLYFALSAVLADGIRRIGNSVFPERKDAL